MKRKQEVIEALNADCQLVGYCVGDFRTSDGEPTETCAIGKLALMAGCSVNDLARVNRTAIDSTRLKEIRERIQDTFGLSSYDLKQIQSANDNEDGGLAARRKAVVEYVAGLPDYESEATP